MTTGLQPVRSGSGMSTDCVREQSDPQQNRRIDAMTQKCLEGCVEADREAIGLHLDALEREWDVERYLQLNAGLLSLSSIMLGAAVSRRFLVVPAAVFAFFFEHATQGWCPPLPIFRRVGVRTRREINREKYALKALRGDFAQVSAGPPSDQEER